ncbi:hypothetical protein SLA2020_183460 [Shorea laevis]
MEGYRRAQRYQGQQYFTGLRLWARKAGQGGPFPRLNSRCRKNGYMPPEYREVNTAATVMTDVNSFGISMIEIATPRRPNWPVTFDGVGVGLVEWARKMAEPNREMEMLRSKCFQ